MYDLIGSYVMNLSPESKFGVMDGMNPGCQLEASGFRMTPFHLNLGEKLGTKEMVEIDNRNIDLVAAFFSEGYGKMYAEEGLEPRYEIAESFYEIIKSNMGITASISFEQFADPLIAGGYDDDTDSISLNVNYLGEDDCRGLLSTILHESRHALQHKVVSESDCSLVSDEVCQKWALNFENYILPEWDREAYRHQPVEEDAYDYEETIMSRGLSAIGLV